MIYLLPLTVKVKKLALEQSESPVTNDMQAEAKEVLVGSAGSILVRTPIISRGLQFLSGGWEPHTLPTFWNPTNKIQS